MNDLRSSRNLIKRLHRREKATIDRVVHAVTPIVPDEITTHSPFTEGGLAVEDQIHKSFRAGGSLGLPIF